MNQSTALEKVTYSGIEFDVDRSRLEMWAKDIDVGSFLGYSRPIAIRKLIREMIASKKLNDSEVILETEITAKKYSRLGGRPGTGYLLSKRAVLKVIFNAGTAIAIDAANKMIDVLEAVERGEFVHKSLLKAEERYKQLETTSRIVETKLLEQIDSYKNLATLSDGGANESRVCDPGNELLQDTLKTQFKHLGQYVALSTNRVIEDVKKNDEKTKIGSIYTITVSKGRLLSKTISLVMQGVLPPSYLGINASPVRPPEPIELPIFQWAKEQGLIDSDWNSWQH